MPNMSILHLTATTSPNPLTWPLTTIVINHTCKTTHPTRLLLDRATGEFGIVTSHTSSPVYTLAECGCSKHSGPIQFSARATRAACWRTKCKKVTLLFEHMQIDLEFVALEQALSFLHVVEDIAMSMGSRGFFAYKVPSGVPFIKADFDMVKHGFVDRGSRNWVGMSGEFSGWPRLRKSGEWSDLTIIAEGRRFAVHRVRLCHESHYFKTICSGGFAESVNQLIELPESAKVVAAMLDELYETYNSTTGSLFTNFALRAEIEKEQLMMELLSLFIACDKYNLEMVKRKVSQAIVDRLTFIKDPLTIIDIASEIHRDMFPPMDCGLKKSLIVQMHARLPAILEDEIAWEEYHSNHNLLKAFHRHERDRVDDDYRDTMLTPSVAPTTAEK